MNKNILEINYFHIELGHTLEEYKEQFGTLYEEGDLWDFSLEDVKTNAVEGDFNTLYWGIVVDDKLRVFETTIREEFEINYQLVKDYTFFTYTKIQNNCVIDAYNEWCGTEHTYAKEVVTEVILQDYEFLKYVFLEECFYMYKWLSDYNCYEERNIRLVDDCETLFVTTNAPSFLIEEAIKYRDMILENNLPFCSDFECVRDYIKEKGFTFKQINVSYENYYW